MNDMELSETPIGAGVGTILPLVTPTTTVINMDKCRLECKQYINAMRLRPGDRKLRLKGSDIAQQLETYIAMAKIDCREDVAAELLEMRNEVIRARDQEEVHAEEPELGHQHQVGAPQPSTQLRYLPPPRIN